MNKSRQRAQRIAVLGIFTGILLLQTYVPFLGYLTIIPAMPGISLIIMVVMVAAVVLGPQDGAILGLIWGILSLIHAYTTPGTITFLLFTNPIIAIVPRMFVGWLAGILPVWFAKTKLPQTVGLAITGLLGAASNTLLVVCLTSVIFLNNSSNLLNVMQLQGDSRNLFIILIVSLGVNGISEAIGGFIIVPLLARPLKHVWDRRRS
ncbi:ECF transporter S component [Lapidilactobacillus mulanensis]|uniref:ECF transporter S component n=1 Tax=Lapidilactobacillus mulanensis TaxID=2485999 RepID=A0ABW4DNZ5_9LACO|nr:ECF transporter S component [Lapidilactobacillus mulanensis]